MKILIIRLSSMGDIVLTSPVIRCVKQQVPNSQLHFLTKRSFRELVNHSPYIDEVLIYNDTTSFLDTLRQQHYDFVIDLQRNHLSSTLRHATKAPYAVYDKEDFRRSIVVLAKHNVLRYKHVVDRYFSAVTQSLQVHNDGLGLELFYPKDNNKAPTLVPPVPYLLIACGAQHYTKQIPIEALQQIISKINGTIVLVGDQQDAQKVEPLTLAPNVINRCGQTTLNQLAQLIDHATIVLTPDTGAMHIAAALRKNIIAIWGSTAPILGFTPYGVNAWNSQAPDIHCSPCSKIGGHRCPRGHFRCMRHQPWDRIIDYINDQLASI